MAAKPEGDSGSADGKEVPPTDFTAGSDFGYDFKLTFHQVIRLG